MDYIRRAEDRGRAYFGWLKSQHSFSFGHYYDPRHMGFSILRVINDDEVDPGAGFDPHGHANMEIISYITQGAIAHKDSMGHEYVIPAGDIQRMSAGTGISHSEYNASNTEPLKFLQIWIEPKQRNIEPSYEQKSISHQPGLHPLMTPSGEGESLSINADASIYRLNLAAKESITLSKDNEGTRRSKYLHIVEGQLMIGDQIFKAGDGIGLASSPTIELTGLDKPAAALWFDLPAVNH